MNSSLSLTKSSHKIFLETLIETRNFTEATKAAGVSKATANALLQKYSNIYKALFAKLGLTEENVLMVLKENILNPEEVRYDAFGRPVVSKDRSVQLKAIETYGKLVGAISSGANVNVQIGNGEAVEEKTKTDEKIYNNIKASPQFTAIQETVLAAIEKANQEA